jgi:2-oxoglutarate ferredoxin oxidoreductase subunit alpha
MIENAGLRTRMMLKRMKKIEGLRDEIASAHFHSKQNAKATLIGWGSTYGAIMEAASILEQDNLNVNVLQLNELWPFPAEAVVTALDATKPSIVIENNITGQLARLIKAETGINPTGNIRKFDGRPFSPSYIVKEVKKEVA